MSEEGDIYLMNIYLTIALMLWIPLGYILLLQYLDFNHIIFWFFGALGLVYFILALIQISRMKGGVKDE